MTTQKFRAELNRQIRHGMGYSEVMGEVLGILADLRDENFVGNGPAWGRQYNGLRDLAQGNGKG